VDDSIQLVRRPGVAHLSICGEQDVFTAGALRERIHGSIGEGMACVIDLSRCTALDSTVLAVLLGGARRAGEGRLGFVLVVDPAPDDAVRRILDLAGLMPTFRVYSDSATALEALAAPAS
jgi:anti-anti-sigma factor